MYLRIRLLWNLDISINMTTHELANILLQQQDVPVAWYYYHDEADCYMCSCINHAELYCDTLYLFENEKDSPAEVECRRIEYECQWDAECRRRAEEEAKKITWGKLLDLTSKETQDAFLLFKEDEWDRERYKSIEIDPHRINRVLSSWFVSNARLSKECMQELVSAATTLGFEIKQELIDYLGCYARMTRYNTDSEQLAALKAARNTSGYAQFYLPVWFLMELLKRECKQRAIDLIPFTISLIKEANR